MIGPIPYTQDSDGNIHADLRCGETRCDRSLQWTVKLPSYLTPVVRVSPAGAQVAKYRVNFNLPSGWRWSDDDQRLVCERHRRGA